MPFAGNKVGAAIVVLPRLSLQQYASLRAELALWPERSGEILRRYHVMNEAARCALDVSVHGAWRTDEHLCRYFDAQFIVAAV